MILTLNQKEYDKYIELLGMASMKKVDIPAEYQPFIDMLKSHDFEAWDQFLSVIYKDDSGHETPYKISELIKPFLHIL